MVAEMLAGNSSAPKEPIKIRGLQAALAAYHGERVSKMRQSQPADAQPEAAVNRKSFVPDSKQNMIVSPEKLGQIKNTIVESYNTLTEKVHAIYSPKRLDPKQELSQAKRKTRGEEDEAEIEFSDDEHGCNDIRLR